MHPSQREVHPHFCVVRLTLLTLLTRASTMPSDGAIGHVRIEGDSDHDDDDTLPQQPAPRPLPSIARQPRGEMTALQRSASALQQQPQIGDARIEGEDDDEEKSHLSPASGRALTDSEMRVRLPCGTCQAMLPTFLLEWDGVQPAIEKTVWCDHCSSRQHIRIEPKRKAATPNSAVTHTESGYHT